jgi:hypothetical protein
VDLSSQFNEIWTDDSVRVIIISVIIIDYRADSSEKNRIPPNSLGFKNTNDIQSNKMSLQLY